MWFLLMFSLLFGVYEVDAPVAHARGRQVEEYQAPAPRVCGKYGGVNYDCRRPAAPQR